jgi:hypothetical protein
MYPAMTNLVDRLDTLHVGREALLPWACPVPFFGDPLRATVATVGINPSNREFLGMNGHELRGADRRLPTLTYFGVDRWGSIHSGHLREIVVACREYFLRRPYTRWFGVLERILQGVGTSYFGARPTACHLDLVPYATAEKWGRLSGTAQTALLRASGDGLGMVLRDSAVQVLILNGRSVVDKFEVLAGVRLSPDEKPSWALPRASVPAIAGLAYTGTIVRVGTVPLPAPVKVLGFNHNLQSSYGVTREVLAEVSGWIAGECRKMTLL